jgi:hypothetical protein
VDLLGRRSVVRTKWEILQARADRLRKELSELEFSLKWMENTNLHTLCACGEMLQTEKDFADHFLVPDERYLNLGNCKKNSTL